uniref:Reticulon-like protein n=1 Tax=Tanacetum cinerariifolium TaxID=118510 RepID=A0A6L2J8E1_TANCI|nr:reticulon-like protein B2 [Tanacetum cinerariifolium]
MADNPTGSHEHVVSSNVDVVKEKITETFHDDDSSSSSDSDGKSNGKAKKDYPVPPKKIKIVSWKDKPVYDLLGGGKPADIFLWRNKKKTAGMLGFATLIWALFELIEYHFLSLLCHILIVVLGIHFLWSNTLNLFYKCPQFPQVALEEDIVLQLASILRIEINNGLEVLREISSGKDLKKFLAVIACLWIVSIAGSCCTLLTLVYTCFVLVHTVPVLYEKHKEKADVLLEKAEVELKKHFEVLHEKVLSKVPGSFKDKKVA